MQTVKRKASGKIVLKNGKVSCGCCSQPTWCCMYPAQALVDGLYTNDDLPDTIIIELTNQLQPGPEYCPREVLSRSYDGYLYGYGNPLDTTPGNKAARISLFFSEEQQGWFFSYLQVEYKEPGAGAENRVYIGDWEDTCLLQDTSGELIIEDQFANSYTVTGPPGGPVTVTRQSLCVWSGPDSCGNEVRLEFISDNDENDHPYWIISWLQYFGPVGDCNVLDSSSSVKDPYAQGGNGIDTPVGSYGPSFSVS